jgi:hypothetical protein
MSASTKEHRDQAPESINCAVVTVSDVQLADIGRSIL